MSSHYCNTLKLRMVIAHAFALQERKQYRAALSILRPYLLQHPGHLELRERYLHIEKLKQQQEGFSRSSVKSTEQIAKVI